MAIGAIHKQPVHSQAAGAAPRTRPMIVVAILATGAGLFAAIALRGALMELVRRWTVQEEYSYGFFVPLVSGWLIWARRDLLLAGMARPAWTGTGLIVVAMLMHFIGQFSAILIFSQLAFIVTLMGITLSIGGFSLLGAAFVPVAFLAFAIPLPYFIDASLSLQLQLISSRLGVAFIELFHIPVYLAGNVIDLGTYKLQVVDACSGLRYLFPLLCLSFLAAYLFQAPIWQRAVVLLSSIPITIGMNGLRIGIIGVTVDRWGPQMAEGALHFFEGWIIFAASALLLSAELSFLARISGKRLSEAVGAAAKGPLLSRAEVRMTDRKPLYACLLLTCAAVSITSLISNRIEQVPERSRFVIFPTTIGDWQGYSSLLAPDVEQSLKVDDYLLSDYRDSRGKIVNLYVAYYASQRTGESPHSPLVCIPGTGWLITAFRRASLGAGFPINRAVIEQGGAKQLVYYWYEERGRKLASEYWSKWYLFYDALTLNRSDGALVRLITTIEPGEQEHDADARLGRFAQSLGSSLNAFLASGDPTFSQMPDSRTVRR